MDLFISSLNTNRCLGIKNSFFVPTVNVDGASLVEEHWLSEKKIINKRKNMNPNLDMCGDENSGVDLNRNWGIDW